jgi:hypothetical protein
MSDITYTFAGDCPVTALAGVTVTGGKIQTILVNKVVTEVVVFETKVNGQSVTAKVAGKPELEAAVASIKAADAKAKADARTALELAVPGLAAYEAASTAYSNAAHAYDRACDRSGGYPVNEAAEAKDTDAALQAVFSAYPATKLWAQIEKYSFGSNYDRAGAADAAKKAVMAGVPLADAVVKMDADWSAAAERAVRNS